MVKVHLDMKSGDYTDRKQKYKVMIELILQRGNYRDVREREREFESNTLKRYVISARKHCIYTRKETTIKMIQRY